jgi:predicted nucleotidyltransferase component of viral defense system
MISEAQLRQYAHQTGANRLIALQEVALTYVLGAIYGLSWSDRLAFKGGTALRKLMFGADGRFSVDLDFLGAQLDDDQVLEIADRLDGASFHGLEISFDDSRFTTSEPDHFDRPTPHGFSADCTFVCPLGTRPFGLDISRRRASLLPLRRLELKPESYHPYLEFTLPKPLSLALEESVAEKVSALARRLQHGSAKDVYDLYLYLPRPHNQQLLARLVALTLWSDRRMVYPVEEFIDRVAPGAFRWEELAGLLPKLRVDPERVCATVRTELGRVFAAMSAEDQALVEDAATHRLARVYEKLAATL